MEKKPKDIESIEKAEYKQKNLMSIIWMIVGTLIYSFAVIWMLDLGGFYAGGITGLSQIIVKLLAKINVNLPIAVFVFALNVPVCIIAWKGVSRRFAYLSLGSVVLQSVTIFILEKWDFSPFEALGAMGPDGTYDAGRRLTLAIFGGLVYGIGCGITLRHGASTGGMDLLSQYMTIKKGISFVYFSFAMDAIIITLGVLIGNIETGVFTIIRLVISMIVIDRIHTIYNYMKITIVTTEKEAMRQALLKCSNHGITIFEATGGFTLKGKYVLESIVSSYEVMKYREIANFIDPQSFIYLTGIKKVYGLFYKNVIM